jgi:hypothetical protein
VELAFQVYVELAFHPVLPFHTISMRKGAEQHVHVKPYQLPPPPPPSRPLVPPSLMFAKSPVGAGGSGSSANTEETSDGGNGDEEEESDRDVKVTSPVSGRALVVPGGGDRELSDRLRQEGRAVHVLVDGVELGPGEDIERAKGKTPYGEACREAEVALARQSLDDLADDAERRLAPYARCFLPGL